MPGQAVNSPAHCTRGPLLLFGLKWKTGRSVPVTVRLEGQRGQSGTRGILSARRLQPPEDCPWLLNVYNPKWYLPLQTASHQAKITEIAGSTPIRSEVHLTNAEHCSNITSCSSRRVEILFTPTQGDSGIR